MLKAFVLLLCAAGASWLIYTFGFGMLVAFGSIAAAAVLFRDGPVPESDAASGARPASDQTTRWTEI